MDFTNKTIFLTGANRGIGAALLEVLVARGVAKIYAGVRNLDNFKAPSGADVVPVHVDLTNRDSLQAAGAQCTDIDLLINNAGRTCVRSMLDPDNLGDYEKTMATNYFGPIALTQACAPHLIKNNGGVIFILSMAGLITAPNISAYSASKSAMSMAALGFAHELAEHGVHVSNVYPGFVETRMADGFPLPKATPQQIAERSLDGWAAKDIAIFPDVFAQMTKERLTSHGVEILNHPDQVVAQMVAEFSAREDAGT